MVLYFYWQKLVPGWRWSFDSAEFGEGIHFHFELTTDEEVSVVRRRSGSSSEENIVTYLLVMSLALFSLDVMFSDTYKVTEVKLNGKELSLQRNPKHCRIFVLSFSQERLFVVEIQRACMYFLRKRKVEQVFFGTKKPKEISGS